MSTQGKDEYIEVYNSAGIDKLMKKKNKKAIEKITLRAVLRNRMRDIIEKIFYEN